MTLWIRDCYYGHITIPVVFNKCPGNGYCLDSWPGIYSYNYIIIQLRKYIPNITKFTVIDDDFATMLKLKHGQLDAYNHNKN